MFASLTRLQRYYLYYTAVFLGFVILRRLAA